MKWFKHQSDSYSNLKHRQVVSEFGVEAYGLYWLCVELVAQQGAGSRIKEAKRWRKALEIASYLSEERINTLLNCFAQVNLIDKKGLEIGDLFLPKIRDYSDEYTDKVRRESRHNRDNVGLDKNRIDKNRIDKIRVVKSAPSIANKDFFSLGETYVKLLDKCAEKIDRALAESEFEKFILYWTEPNKSGSKVRWEQQPTFDVERRLFTWFSRVHDRRKANVGRGLA